tara:strand:- start:300 stop:1355 length:1056 start_codon:yes stop_codon:yes gene_type:complete
LYTIAKNINANNKTIREIKESEIFILYILVLKKNLSDYFNLEMRLVLILILCIIIVLICILFTNNRKETFKNKTDKQIKFLKANEACNLIQDIDYFHNLNQADLAARKFIIDSKGVVKSYCDNYLNFSKEEKDKITNALKTLPNNELFRKWSFAKMSTSVEDGFPHTHKDTIFLSSHTINESDVRLLFVLIHEQMHVMQRKKPEIFKVLYTKYYPFKIGKLKVQDKYLKRIRSNPDTRYIPDNDYILKTDQGDFYLCAYYGDKKTPEHLGDVLYVAIKCEYDSKKNTYKTTDDVKSISDIPEFVEFFKLKNNHYHPNEISAELIGMHYSKINNRDCDALDSTRIWLKNHVA